MRDKAFKIARNPEYNGYERGLASTFCKYFDKESKGQIHNLQMNFINRLLEKLKDVMSALNLKAILGELNLLMRK